MQQDPIQHVSDTALWVAHYRAKETKRENPIFQDPFAEVLVGDRGKIISDSMGETSRYTEWSVVIRTHIIDNYIQKLTQQGVDTVINLGAGMDTRPYRLSLPKSLRWIEVDYPHVIEHKEKHLSKVKPQVQLEQIALDLSDRKLRKELFKKLGSEAKKALIITEGVLPYLTPEQVTSLAEDLYSEKSFSMWIAEYFSASVYPYLRTPARLKQMKNAPFLFFPEDWFGFFKNLKWQPQEIRYIGEESFKLNRMPPAPWWFIFIRPFLSKKTKDVFMRQMGYVVFTKI